MTRLPKAGVSLYKVQSPCLSLNKAKMRQTYVPYRTLSGVRHRGLTLKSCLKGLNEGLIILADFARKAIRAV